MQNGLSFLQPFSQIIFRCAFPLWPRLVTGVIEFHIEQVRRNFCFAGLLQTMTMTSQNPRATVIMSGGLPRWSVKFLMSCIHPTQDKVNYLLWPNDAVTSLQITTPPPVPELTGLTWLTLSTYSTPGCPSTSHALNIPCVGVRTWKATNNEQDYHHLEHNQLVDKRFADKKVCSRLRKNCWNSLRSSRGCCHRSLRFCAYLSHQEPSCAHQAHSRKHQARVTAQCYPLTLKCPVVDFCL